MTRRPALTASSLGAAAVLVLGATSSLIVGALRPFLELAGEFDECDDD